MSSKNLDFLRRVLPLEGYKCATVINQKGIPSNFFAASFEELEAFISREDALGKTVYHACASFKIPQNDHSGTPRNQRFLGRTHHNVFHARSFWLDIDAGAGKPYPDAITAAEAVNNFCGRLGLPIPLYVSSGSGLHIYWPLVETLDPPEWQAYAAGLKKLCVDHGLQADGARTSDISSVLRTPGTHNRKHGSAIVTAGPPIGPYPLATFGVLKQNGNLSYQPTRRVPKKNSLVAAAINIYGDEEKLAAPITQQCAQMARIAKAPGEANEPQWYAAIGVLAFCNDGLEAAKSWSDPAWHKTIEEKFIRQKEFGPTTCAKFYDVNPSGCAGCPFAGKITSPIQLGKRATPGFQNVVEKILPGSPGADAAQPIQPFSTLPQTTAPGFFAPVSTAGPNLPEGFQWRGDSLYCLTEARNGQPLFTLISQCRLYLHGVQTGETNHDRFSLMFKLKLPNEPEKEIVIRARDFFGAQGTSFMADSGAVIHEPDLFKKYVRSAIDMWHKEHRLEKRYDQFGWKDEETSFLYGKNLYTATAVIPVIGSSEIEQRGQWLRPRPGGSLEKWSQAANALFAEGCEPQSFALLGSFAAPIMRFSATDEGGAIISLNSSRSGSGKTTALAAVASVWGLNKGLSLTNIDTKVSKGLTLAALGNLPVVYDELTDKDPVRIREFVLVFTSGRDKMRGTQEGGIKHTEASWQTLLVSGSNRSLVDFLTTRGVDALAFRVMEFNTKLPPGLHKRGDGLRKELEANAGYAGDIYLRSLLQPEILKWVKSAVPAYTKQIWDRTQLQSQHRFWVRTLASVAVAGAIVNKLGILSFSPQRILDWAIDEMVARKDDAVIMSEETIAGNALGEFLNDHVADMLVMPGPYEPRARAIPILKNLRKLLIRYELKGGRILITESTFRDWLIKNEYSPREVINELKRKLIITRSRTRATLGAGTEYASGQVDCVEVNGRHPLLSGMLTAVNELSAAAEKQHLQSVS